MENIPLLQFAIAVDDGFGDNKKSFINRLIYVISDNRPMYQHL